MLTMFSGLFQQLGFDTIVRRCSECPGFVDLGYGYYV